MEVSFNGKKISVSAIGDSLFTIYEKNINKNLQSSKLPNCFGDAYLIVLKARLGKQGAHSNIKSGIATGALLQSLKLKKTSISSSRLGKKGIKVSMVHEDDNWNQSGWLIGGDISNAVTSTGGALNALIRWVDTRGINNFKMDWYKGKSGAAKSKAMAKLILHSWVSNGKRTIVLPKWYDVFKDGDSEALNQLYKNKGCLEINIKKLLGNG